MMRTRNYTLSEEEVEQLERIIREDERREVVKRATAIRMLHLGQDSSEVGRLLLVSGVSVRNWFSRWQQEGEAGLVNRARSGRPPKATESYWQVVAEALESDPQALGYTFTILDAGALARPCRRKDG